MKATLYDGNGKPTAHIHYETPFEMYWRWVGRLIIAAIVGFLLFVMLVALVGEQIREQMLKEAQAKEQAIAAQGLHRYSIKWIWVNWQKLEKYKDFLAPPVQDVYLWATSIEEARQKIETENNDKLIKILEVHEE